MFMTKRAIPRDDVAGDLLRLIGGVIQHLNLQPVRRVLELAAGINQAIDDELLVIDGKLHGDVRQIGEAPQRLFGCVLLMLVVQIDQLVTVHAIEGEDHHYDEVGDQQRGIKRVPFVQMFEGAIAVVGAEVVADTMLRKQPDCGPGRVFDRSCRKHSDDGSEQDLVLRTEDTAFYCT